MTRPIAGAGFALLAWREAQRRTFDMSWCRGPRDRQSYDSRELLTGEHNGPSREFYRITDRATEVWNTRSSFIAAHYGITVRL